MCGYAFASFFSEIEPFIFNIPFQSQCLMLLVLGVYYSFSGSWASGSIIRGVFYSFSPLGEWGSIIQGGRLFGRLEYLERSKILKKNNQ